jgi:hypothetical protein
LLELNQILNLVPSQILNKLLSSAKFWQLEWRIRDPLNEKFVQLVTFGSGIFALFVWLISHQTAVLFSQNKPATSNQPAVLFSQNKPAPAISHQPNEQAAWMPLSPV